MSCWPEKRKKKTQTHTKTHIGDQISHQTSSSLEPSSEKLFSFLGPVRSIENVKQANVKMLLSALAPCVFRISGKRFFYKQVEPHITCLILVSDVSYVTA